ncbi:hypothetical protein CVT25_001642 [Psilocybe cyanescens]|uniref:AGC-kinase C-terminal domain-containing protein n=1 Tax=Psilocybe cyanescens TaxID=93625 RepID=A0A409W067_PSICY|nr:hypothetical protein CVT25_001642 [Psilocybe cyanescens]
MSSGLFCNAVLYCILICVALFSDWSHVYYKRYIPPYIPPIDPSNASDTQNFDDTFLDMEPVLDEFNEETEATDTDQEPQTDADRTDGDETNTTPSQSRSSSMRPQPQPSPAVEYDDNVFDGYSFKGRHSVLIDDDDDDDEEDEEGSEEGSEESVEEGEVDHLSILRGLDQQQPQQQQQPQPQEQTLESDTASSLQPDDDASQEDGVEPKTPEARPAALPPVPAPTPAAEPEQPTVPQVPVDEILETPLAEVPQIEEVPARRTSRDVPSTAPSAYVGIGGKEKETNGRPSTPPPKSVQSRQALAARGPRSRREKSGVPALDRYLSDGVDEDTEATEAERDEDEDWDFIEAVDGEDRNGAKPTSLFARGVVDRYRLAVFRKASTPGSRSKQQRTASGMSTVSAASTASATATDDSPSPVQRRGRAPGLNFRKHPRQFLRAKSPAPPPSSFSAKSARSVSQSASNSNTLSAGSISSAGVASGGMFTPSLSGGSTLPHSLKSKESAMSVGAMSQSSEQSGNGQSAVFVDSADAKVSPNGAEPKIKKQKLKKYKNGAEKVFSLFSSPRQTS